MSGEFSAERRRLADAMEERGAWPEHSPWIRQAVDAIPRHPFAPDRLWQWDGHAYAPVDRGVDPQGWAALVYGSQDEAAVTQVTGGRATSSLSCQGVVVDMLDSLLPEPGHRVLELGAGTGWNAALLAHHVGAGQVVSVEADPALAEAARRRLDAAGVDVVVGDGNAGWPQGAPFDRVIATYAVETVPWAWIAQTRPGGRIVFPWGRLGHVALIVAEDGRSATGWVQGLAQFMPDRGADAGPTWQEVRGDGPAGDKRALARDITPLRTDPHLAFALRARLPDVHLATGQSDRALRVWLHDRRESWATLTTAGDGSAVAQQGGPRRLVDEVEAAWDWWAAAGSPELYDWGMTVHADGRQAVRLDGAEVP